MHNLKFKPNEIARQYRSFDSLKDFKAHELRIFCIITGPFVLAEAVPFEYYSHFLILNVAILILVDSEFCIKYNRIAETCLKSFVSEFVEIYGEHHVSANIHGLIHLAADVLLHGALDTFSAFKFESFFEKVQRYIQGQKHPVQQISNRFAELNYSFCIDSIRDKKTKDGICLLKKDRNLGEIRECSFFGHKIENDRKNEFVFTKDKQIVSVSNFLKIEGEIIARETRLFCTKRNTIVTREFTLVTSFHYAWRKYSCPTRTFFHVLNSRFS